MSVRLVLSESDERRIERQLSTGLYADASDVVRAGLEMLENLHDSHDRWLVEDVSRRILSAEQEPSILRPADEVFSALELRHQTKLAGQRDK